MGLGSGAVCDIRLNTSLTEEERALFQNPSVIQGLLKPGITVAMVGLSTDKTKPSNMVASYLLDEGFKVIPVHPSAATILGQKCYPDLISIDVPVDVVDVFRPASEVARIAEDAIKIGAKAVWMQLRIIDLLSAEKLRLAGVQAVVDRCMKMEHGRYSGALHFAGMNTEIVTARRRSLR